VTLSGEGGDATKRYICTKCKVGFGNMGGASMHAKWCQKDRGSRDVALSLGAGAWTHSHAPPPIPSSRPRRARGAHSASPPGKRPRTSAADPADSRMYGGCESDEEMGADFDPDPFDLIVPTSECPDPIGATRSPAESRLVRASFSIHPQWPYAHLYIICISVHQHTSDYKYSDCISNPT
jgi:hypothetical protein